jgi:hypothetical protein
LQSFCGNRCGRHRGIALGPTRTVSADVFGNAQRQFLTDSPPQMFFDTDGKIGGFGNGHVHMFAVGPNVGVDSGPFTGLFFMAKNPNLVGTENFIRGSVSGNSASNGFTMVYFGTVTITGGGGRYEGATGTINVTAIQYGIFAPTEFGLIPAEIILDGQYSVQ